jgi:hypothetical protein
MIQGLFTIGELELQKRGLEARINQLELDFVLPAESAISGQNNVKNTHLTIMKRIIELERTYLQKINLELEKMRHMQTMQLADGNA